MSSCLSTLCKVVSLGSLWVTKRSIKSYIETHIHPTADFNVWDEVMAYAKEQKGNFVIPETAETMETAYVRLCGAWNRFISNSRAAQDQSIAS
jgi:hypothetical protein